LSESGGCEALITDLTPRCRGSARSVVDHRSLPLPISPLRSVREGSLLVVLDHTFRSNRGVVGVSAGVAPRPTLTQQVPTLVERDLCGMKPFELVRREPLADMRPLQRMLSVRQ